MPTDAAGTIHERQRLTPGWYWAFVDNDAEGAAALTAFTKANKGNVFVTKTIEGEKTGLIFKEAAPYIWVLFEVKNQTVIWTLPGFPTKAKKAASTNATDIVTDEHKVPAITSPEHPFNQFFGWGWLTGDNTDGSQSNNPLARAGETIRTGLKVLLYGGAAVLLVQLFLATGGLKNILGALPSKEPRRQLSAPRPRSSGRRLALPAGR